MRVAHLLPAVQKCVNLAELRPGGAQKEWGQQAPLLLPKRERFNSKRHTLVIVGAVNLELSDPGVD